MFAAIILLFLLAIARHAPPCDAFARSAPRRTISSLQMISDGEVNMLKFLHEKKVYEAKPIMRIVEFVRLIYPCVAPVNSRPHYLLCRERLGNLIHSKGDNISDTIPSDVQSFADFCELHPAWKDPKDSYVFHRDCLQVKKKSDEVLQQRAQLSGLCYLRGPDVMQHYLVAMNSVEPVGMVDVTKLIRNAFSVEELEDYIFKDKGGDSRMMLLRLLEPGSIVFSWGSISENLKQYGPGLVSGFEVYDDFLNQRVHSHNGAHSGEYVGRHCMVLIGHRRTVSRQEDKEEKMKEKEGKKNIMKEGVRRKENSNDNVKDVYLLQNWWKPKQFVEVDAEYLRSCNPVAVHFVETPQMSIPKVFATNLAKYAENVPILDKPEELACLERDSRSTR